MADLYMPFYLSHTLENMVHYVRKSRHPLSSITNHGLIKLLVQIYLTWNKLTWEQFVGAVVHQEPVVAHIGDREVEHISSGSAGGRDEELEEGEDEQEENSRGAATEENPMDEMVGATIVIEEDVPLAIEGATTV